VLGDKSLKLTGLSMEEQQALIAWFQSQNRVAQFIAVCRGVKTFYASI
jgi:hypothetical protein